MVGFAVAGTISNSYAGFLTIAFVTRFLQGFSSSAIQTTCFSISGMIYKEHQTEVIASLEIASGLGLTIAPVIGSLLYQAGGYSAPFLFYGIIFLLASIFLKKIIPAKVDEKA